jgi:A/G-specific adenine glycosylase
MDLGATVCIARQPRCDACPIAPLCSARGKTYAPLRRQSKFEGSFRQRRAETLRAVIAGQPDPHAEEPEVMASLIKDGLL